MSKKNTDNSKKIATLKLQLAERHPDGHKRAGKYVVWGRGRQKLANEIAALEGTVKPEPAPEPEVDPRDAEIAELKKQLKAAQAKPAKASKKVSKKASKKKASKKVSKRTAAVKKAASKKVEETPYTKARAAQRAFIASHGLGELEASDLYQPINEAKKALEARNAKGVYELWGMARKNKMNELEGLQGIQAEAVKVFNNAKAAAEIERLGATG